MIIEQKTFATIDDNNTFRGVFDLYMPESKALLDWKTCADLEQSQSEKMMSHQLPAYALSLIANGTPVDYIEYRFIRKPTKQLKSGRGKNPVPQSDCDYLEELLDEYRKSPNVSAAKLVIPLTPHRLEQAQIWLSEGSDDISRSRRLQRYPQNLSACKSFNTSCQFLPVCELQFSGGNVESCLDKFYEKKDYRINEDNEIESPSFLSQSGLTCYRSCQRRYYYEYERELQRKTETTRIALYMGRLFHVYIAQALSQGIDSLSTTYIKDLDNAVDRKSAEIVIRCYAMSIFAYEFFILGEYDN